MAASLSPFACSSGFVGEELDAARLEVLERYDPDSLENDRELNELRAFASELCDTPIALVTLVEADRQRFLSRQGVPIDETPRDVSFCQHAMIGERVMVVPDALEDARFVNNALVTGEPKIRFYAGAPLVSEEGAPLGALCVISTEPRETLTPLQLQGLEVLAQAVMRRLEARRREVEWTAGAEEARRLLQESESKFDNLADALPTMAWSTDGKGNLDYLNKRWYDFTGVEEGAHDGARWADAVHPDDREEAIAVWQASVESGEPYETEYRLRKADGEYRWTLARGLPVRNDDGEVIRWFGTNTDIQQHRELMESHALLTKELSHRIKNIFSVVTGLVSFASRSHPEIKEVATSIGDRINALGRAHNYVRPLANLPSEGVTLHAVLYDLFAPYADASGDRVTIEGGDFAVAESAVTPFALVFHELATNAVKYGALSVPDGHVTLKIADEGEEICIYWCEQGGPPAAEPEHKGFGSDLLTTSLERQLKGEVERRWTDHGLEMSITLPKNKITI